MFHMVMGFSNQPIGIGKGKEEKKYIFSKKELDKNKVPSYAYDLKEEGDTVSFKCSFNSFGEPIVKKGG